MAYLLPTAWIASSALVKKPCSTKRIFEFDNLHIAHHGVQGNKIWTETAAQKLYDYRNSYLSSISCQLCPLPLPARRKPLPRPRCRPSNLFPYSHLPYPTLSRPSSPRHVDPFLCLDKANSFTQKNGKMDFPYMALCFIDGGCDLRHVKGFSITIKIDPPLGGSITILLRSLDCKTQDELSISTKPM